MLSIDGSYGEGGGQIVRTSVSLSAITGRPVRISEVRAGRSKPGLQAQHLAAVQAMAQVCAAELEGAERGSTEFSFSPQSAPVAGSYFFDIGTAGSAALVLQTVLLPLALCSAPSHVRIVGGTYNPHAPSADYLEHVYLPILHRMGVNAELQVLRAGYYPRGGGVIECSIEPAGSVKPIDLVERGEVLAVEAHVVTSALPQHVGQRGGEAIKAFGKEAGVSIDVKVADLPSFGTGAAVLLIATCTVGRAGFLSIGERGKPMERVALEACEDFSAWLESGASCDEHLADQLMLPAVLASSDSAWTTPVVSGHLSTVAWLAQQFDPVEVRVEACDERGALVRVAGREVSK